MRSLDYAPLYRSTVGFDRLFDLLDNSVRTDWPPYNIEKTGDNDYRITMAIAGFTPEEVELTQHGPELIVVGQKQTEDSDRQILHRGMATRNFKHVFRLADYVKVANATLENGLLSVDLVRDIPEELKPRRIGISTEKPASQNKQISQDTQPQSKVA
ncbi:Hsp20 family protein [Mesorhizobium sp. YC-39]|uniref:Hsp20 family protein n=1 Tax=unclassified Mesorhizobium TaxID=325217 RepID=UPI0021E7429C|nr:MULTISPECIES: Hsp20 family protein [unclassified Mesorhizobium]MCV3210026.1 Hsp20 family protein [Mesorhizobium sp. YC-2]MCV3230556.1 Hsp20 family protein [Mesorhizobium sp. YC-39]